MFAKLVGEGYERPEGDDAIPLDINYGKVGEWLLDRKLIPQDWAKRLQAIQAKAAEAAKELPSGFLNQFDGGEDASIDYLKSKHILAKLTETAEKNLLGSLKGSAGTWERITKAYETNLLHLAEAGLIMARNVDYDIPYFKKQAAKNQQLIADLDKKWAEALKSAATAATEFQRECSAMGIPSPSGHSSSKTAVNSRSATEDALRLSLLDLTMDLPSILSEALQSLQEDTTTTTAAAAANDSTTYQATPPNGLIGRAMAYYEDYTMQSAAMHPNTAREDAMLCTLSEVRRGDTPPPAQQCLLGRALLSRDMGSKNTTAASGADIDWGLSMDAPDTATDDTSEKSALTGAISWDFDVEPAATAEAASSHGASDGAIAGISWDIDISDVGEAIHGMDATPGISDGDSIVQTSRGVAKSDGDNAQNNNGDRIRAQVERLIVDKEYRSKLLDDLYELKAFLTQRGVEMKAGMAPSGVHGVSTTPLSHVDAPAVHAMLGATKDAILALTEARVVQLLSLLSNEAYRERMVAKLAQQAGQEAKFKTAAQDTASRKNQAQRTLMAESAKLASLVRHTKEVKTMVEVGLGGKLKKGINVQGEINSLLSQV